jgi:hypothetical protein
MGAYVIEDSFGEQLKSGYRSARSRASLLADRIPNLGGADLDVQSGEKVEGCAISGGIVEPAGSDRKLGAGRLRAGRGIHS